MEENRIIPVSKHDIVNKKRRELAAKCIEDPYDMDSLELLYIYNDDPDDLETPDIIVSVIDPLPSLLMESAANISKLMEFNGDVIWLINRDNPGVNRHVLKKYLGFIPDHSQEEIPREMICRAEYNCIELPEIVHLKGIEDLADHILKIFALRV